MTAQEMIERITSGKEPELVKKIAACKNADQVYEAAKAAGLTTPKDEAVRVFKEWQSKARTLSDSDLEKVAGGRHFQWPGEEIQKCQNKC